MGHLIYSDRSHSVASTVRTWKTTGMAFAAADPGCMRRMRAPSQIVLHWTGGEGTAQQVHRTLRDRSLSVHFYIDFEGIIWQFADPRYVTCSHASGCNRNSVGVEIQSRGLKSNVVNPGKFTRVPYVDIVHGVPDTFLQFTPAQERAIIDLVESYCSTRIVERAVPEDEEGDVLRETMNEPEKFRGVLGHYHITSKKLDPGPRIFETLRAYWRSLEVV